MKNIFLTVNKKWIISFIAFVMIVPLAIGLLSIKKASMPKPQYTIVIDAGHGGRDGGAVGKNTGVTESELNLKYAKQLKNLCEDFGFGVVMTRNDMNGLYDDDASNKKRSEMEKRKKIINQSGADVMISIHMNAFPLESCSGANVFYANRSENGFRLAKGVQSSLSQSFDNARGYVTVGDYFVLNVSTIPAILVECGFLSNPTEENLLVSDEYCERFCYSLLAGILSYFEM